MVRLRINGLDTPARKLGTMKTMNCGRGSPHTNPRVRDHGPPCHERHRKSGVGRLVAVEQHEQRRALACDTQERAERTQLHEHALTRVILSCPAPIVAAICAVHAEVVLTRANITSVVETEPGPCLRRIRVPVLETLRCCDVTFAMGCAWLRDASSS